MRNCLEKAFGVTLLSLSTFSTTAACRGDESRGAGGTPATGGSGGANTGGVAGALGGAAGAGAAGGASGSGGQAGSGFGGDSSCIGKVVWANPLKPSYQWDATLVDFLTLAPVTGVTVKVCAIADTACSVPLQTETSDLAGKVTLSGPSSPEGIAAYLEITGGGVTPTLEFLRYSDNTTLDGGKVQITLASTTTQALFVGVLGVTADPKRGTLTYVAWDCAPLNLAGVSASLDPADSATVTAYLVGAVPSKTATETDASGFGGFVNVPPGPVTLKGKSAKTGQSLGSVKLFVREGFNSQTVLPPTP